MIKTKTSSFLDPDFSIEDISTGFYTDRKSKAGALAISNQMGLLSSLKDVHNTDQTNFAIESTRLLGESNALSNYVAHSLGEINRIYSVVGTIKERYGVEKLDPYTFSQEAGVKEFLKGAWNAIVAAFKKIIQAISNFFNMIKNFIGSQIAKTQEKLVEQYGQASSGVAKAKSIKAPDKLPSYKDFSDLMININSGVDAITANFDMLAPIFDKLADMEGTNVHHTKWQGNGPVGYDKTQTDYSDVKDERRFAISEKVDKEMKKLEDYLNKNHMFSKNQNGTTVKSASEVVNVRLFGKTKPLIKERKPGDVLKGVDYGKMLGRDGMDLLNSSVKEGRSLIKIMNDSIKVAIKAAKNSEKFLGKEKEKESQKMQKANRKLLQTLNRERNYGGKAHALYLAAFSAYLRTRGYIAAAMKSVISASKKEDK